MSGGARSAVAVRIDGNEYKLRGDGDDAGLVRIAGYVDRAMKRVRERTGTVGSLDVAILTCLNLAREILALHERRTETVDDARIRALIEKVEAALSVEMESAKGLDGTEMGAIPEQAATRDAQRTLELPPVEDLRERIAASAASTAAGREIDAREERPLARAAGGGRERGA